MFNFILQIQTKKKEITIHTLSNRTKKMVDTS